MKKLFIPSIILFGIIFLAGCIQQQVKKQPSATPSVKQDKTQQSLSVQPTNEWQKHKSISHGISFQYPKDWYVIEDESIDRIYIRNVQNKTSKGNRPSDFQQLWISTWEQEINSETENNVKGGKPDGREFGGPLSAGIIDRDDFIINTYEYRTIGGQTLQAFWNDKSGKRYYATNATEVGQENQQKMVENLKKILATVEFTK